MNQNNATNPISEKTIRQKYSSLPKRVFTSCIFLSYLALVIYLDLKIFDKPYSLLFSGIIISSLIVFEFYQMALACGQKPFIKTGIFFTSLLFATPLIQKLINKYFFDVNISNLQIIILCASILTFFWLQGQKPTCDKAFEQVGPSICGVVYIGLLGSFMIQIAWLPAHVGNDVSGVSKLLFFVLVTKMTDIGAFMIGVAFGKHKWIPRISPGKSIEGLIGGIISSVLLAVLLNEYAWSIFNSNGKVILFAVLIAYCGQLSDLIESVFKRAANFKDSGNILPGFGGFFDLTDSLILTAPLAFILFTILS